MAILFCFKDFYNCSHCFHRRFLNNEELIESETVQTEYIAKSSSYQLTLTGDLKDKGGKVKIIAENVGGEATSEAELTISGRAATFVEKPIKCTVLAGK